MILSTTNLEATKNTLLENGITLKQDIVNANNFLKFLVIEDPDGLIVEIAEYLINDMLEKKL